MYKQLQRIQFHFVELGRINLQLINSVIDLKTDRRFVNLTLQIQSRKSKPLRRESVFHSSATSFSSSQVPGTSQTKVIFDNTGVGPAYVHQDYSWTNPTIY